MTREIPQIWGNVTEKDSKVIQVYFEGIPYLWHAPASETKHAKILSKLLANLRVPYKTRLDFEKKEVPLEKDEDLGYELIGAGMAKKISENSIKYYGDSLSYMNLSGINLKHLEDVFKDKKTKIITEKGSPFLPIYVVKFFE